MPFQKRHKINNNKKLSEEHKRKISKSSIGKKRASGKNHYRWIKDRSIVENNAKEYRRKWYMNNREKVKEKSSERYKNNKEERILQIKNWREKNKDKYKKIIKEWKRKNPHYLTNYTKERKKIDPKFHLDCNMGTLIYQSLRKQKAKNKWEDLVGYNLKDLMSHLEKQFENWMSWNNYGQWHIDHIKPKSLFNYKTPEDLEFKKCWSLENLQPLEKIANIKKGNKYE
jgi:hypothetical protein